MFGEGYDLNNELRGKMEEKNSPIALPRSLYLRLGDTTFFVARYEMRDEPVFACANYRLNPQLPIAANLNEAVQREPLLSSPAIATHVVVGGEITLVPLADFQEEECEAIYDSIFPSKVRRRVFYDTIPQVNAVMLFSLDEALCASIESLFDRVIYQSCFTAVLRRFAKKTVGQMGVNRIYVYGYERGILVSAFVDGRLMTMNAYPATAPSDVAYYTLSVAHHLGISVEAVDIFVAGSEEQRKVITTELQKFAPSVVSVNPSAEYNRHIVTKHDDVPYDMIALLAE